MRALLEIAPRFCWYPSLPLAHKLSRSLMHAHTHTHARSLSLKHTHELSRSLMHTHPSTPPHTPYHYLSLKHTHARSLYHASPPRSSRVTHNSPHSPQHSPYSLQHSPHSLQHHRTSLDTLTSNILHPARHTDPTLIPSSPHPPSASPNSFTLSPLPHFTLLSHQKEGRYKAPWKRKFKLPWRKAGLVNSSR